MPSWIYDALSSFQSFMDRGSFLDLVGAVVVAGVGSILLVAVHELGHALAARARGAPVHTIRVGDRALITLPIGTLRVELGWASGKGDVGGYVTFGTRHATPTDLLVISLAGPAASFIAATACAVLAVALISHGMVGVIIGLLGVQGLAMAIGNLIPFGDAQGMWSDGRWAMLAWAARHEPRAVLPDRHAATSVAPPRRSS